MTDFVRKPLCGAYGVWINANRLQLAERAAEAGAPGIVATNILGGEMWQEMSKEERAPWEAKYLEIKATFEAYLQSDSYKALEERAKVSVVGESGQELNKPCKPASSPFGFFTNLHREEFSRDLENKGLKFSYSLVAKLANERWQSLSDAEKVAYDNRHRAAAEQYRVGCLMYNHLKRHRSPGLLQITNGETKGDVPEERRKGEEEREEHGAEEQEQEGRGARPPAKPKRRAPPAASSPCSGSASGSLREEAQAAATQARKYARVAGRDGGCCPRATPAPGTPKPPVPGTPRPRAPATPRPPAPETPKPRRAGAGRGKAGGWGELATASPVRIPWGPRVKAEPRDPPVVHPTILAEAERLGLRTALLNLAGRAEVVDALRSGKVILDALKFNGGAVKRAKAALLGA